MTLYICTQYFVHTTLLSTRNWKIRSFLNVRGLPPLCAATAALRRHRRSPLLGADGESEGRRRAASPAACDAQIGGRRGRRPVMSDQRSEISSTATAVVPLKAVPRHPAVQLDAAPVEHISERLAAIIERRREAFCFIICGFRHKGAEQSSSY